MTQQEFIDKIAPYMIKYAKQYGYSIVSAAIAQGCLESAYGTSYKAKWNNYFGLKYRANRVNCNSGYFTDGGSEQNPDGSYTPLPSSTAWYAFADIDKGCEGYYQFINIPNYAAVKASTTPLMYLQAIKNAGYATSNNYVQNVYNVISKWGLEKYDQQLAVTSSSQEKTNDTNLSLNIQKISSTVNTSYKNNRAIQWIVLHYTAGTRSIKGSAKSIANYFARPTTKASADYIVDDAEIVQYNPDPKNYYCWSVGGKKYSSMATSLGGKYYGICSNNNSISIEMCSNKKNTATLNASDDDWYLTEATVNNAVQLTKYLMNLYNIDADHVIMHHMVTGKWCPQPWCKNESALIGWNNFITKIKGAGTQSNVTPVQNNVATPASAYLVRINTDVLNVRKGPSTNYPITTQIKRGSVYTIVAEESGWGLLKSYQKDKNGWIKLSYTISY